MGKDGYGYFKIPVPGDATGDEATTCVTGGSENYAISADCKHPDEAVEFLKFIHPKNRRLSRQKKQGFPTR